jgi:cell division protein ZapA
MGQVSVTINNRQYRMACEDGQEDHLARLAHDLDARIARLRADFGEIGDMRLTVMAALLLADELAEARQRMRRIEEELLGLQHERIAAAGRTDALQADVAAAINAAAERIERLTRLLADPVDGHRLALG